MNRVTTRSGRHEPCRVCAGKFQRFRYARPAGDLCRARARNVVETFIRIRGLRFRALSGQDMRMYFVGLVKFTKKQTKEAIAANLKRIDAEVKEGVRVHGIYWTLGRYDAIAIFEAPDEKTAMKMSIRRFDDMHMETLVAVPMEEARKLLE